MQDNKLSASNMWKTSTQVTQSTYGVYQRMRANFVQDYVNVFYWGEARVGDYMWGKSLHDNVQDTDMITVRESTMTASTKSCAWNALYTTIDQANAVLKYADIVDMSDSDYAFAVGQAAFARAYCYFWAARLWGNVPLNLVPIESTTQPECYPERTSKDLVYEQIGKDIETAEKYAASLGSDKYFATADAVHMLKLEWALWMYTDQQGGKEYLEVAEEALAALNIKASDSRFLTSYSKIFDYSNKRNSEIVFALKNGMDESLTGGYYKYFYHAINNVAKQYQNNPVPVQSTQWWSYSREFLEVLRESRDKAGDSRAQANLGDGNYSAAGGLLVWCNKFLGDMSGATVQNDADLIYYRFGQAVMMAAELKYYEGQYAQANNYLNMIAKRAYGKDSYYTSTTKNDVLEALTHEYFMEFPAEGVIWWALIRLDKIWEYNPALVEKRKTNPNILLWPISASSRNKNPKLEQTEGWS